MINHSENSTYLVTPQGGARPVILRVHRDAYHTINGIRSELAWMRALQAEASVLTPQAIPGQRRAGYPVGRAPDLGVARNCVLFELIDGIEPPPDHSDRPPSAARRSDGPLPQSHPGLGAADLISSACAGISSIRFGREANWGAWRDGPDMHAERAPLLGRTVDRWSGG